MSKTLSRKFEKRFNWVQGCWIAAQWLLIGNGIITLCNLGEELVYLYKRFGFGIVVRIMTRDKQLIASPEFSITIGKSQFTERVDGGKEAVSCSIEKVEYNINQMIKDIENNQMISDGLVEMLRLGV